MDIRQSNSDNHARWPDGIEALYPVPPLSWLAPLWSYVCGVIASSAAPGAIPPAFPASGQVASRFSGYGGSALLFLLGLLLAGPLLGVTWGAGGQIRRHRERAVDPSPDPAHQPVGSVPYTLPGSASHTLASWLGAVLASLQEAAPAIGVALVRLVAGSVFALAVAAALGRSTLAITTAALLYVLARSLAGGRRAVQSVPGGAEIPVRMLDLSLPMLITWLIGHTTHATLRVESVLVATCFAVVLWSCSHLYQTGKGLLRLLVPQALVVAYFIAARQPVTAAGVALLASAQLLWSPLLQTPAGRREYVRSLQLPLAMMMLLSAWTLGHGP